MPFTATELDNMANQTLDYYFREGPWSQTLQDRPLYDALRRAQKTFPGGKDSIRGNVKGDYTTSFMGYSHDDTVTYANPANVKQFDFPWVELHAGIKLTMTELKHAGITVVDSLSGERTMNHSEQEEIAITNLFEDKLEDMAEGSARSFNQMCYLDGTQAPKVFAGLQSLIADDPTTGVFAGIDRAANAWWRNRALVGANKITASAANQTLTKKLRSEVRQLHRYGGKPSMLMCGSEFIEALELEVSEKGTYTDQGFSKRGQTEIGMADITMRGVGAFKYDPTLDDIDRSKFCYMVDPRHTFLMVMDGEDMKSHAPARPAEQYVIHRGKTWTGGFICRKPNANEVVEVA